MRASSTPSSKTPDPPLDIALQRLLATEMPTQIGGIETEFARLPHLEADVRFVQRRVAGNYRECLQAQCAADALKALPGPHQAVHMLIGGKFALWDFVPAVLLLAKPAKIQALTIATLGFSKRNILALARMLDAGEVRKCRLLCSHYFSKTSTPIYTLAEAELAKRRPRTSFLSVRTHAKILAMKMTDGRTVVIETSANLRSCKNIEQMTAFGDPALYKFHTGWIDDLFSRARKEPAHGQVKAEEETNNVPATRHPAGRNLPAEVGAKVRRHPAAPRRRNQTQKVTNRQHRTRG